MRVTAVTLDICWYDTNGAQANQYDVRITLLLHAYTTKSRNMKMNLLRAKNDRIKSTRVWKVW